MVNLFFCISTECRRYQTRNMKKYSRYGHDKNNIFGQSTAPYVYKCPNSYSGPKNQPSKVELIAR